MERSQAEEEPLVRAHSHYPREGTDFIWARGARVEMIGNGQLLYRF